MRIQSYIWTSIIFSSDVLWFMQIWSNSDHLSTSTVALILQMHKFSSVSIAIFLHMYWYLFMHKNSQLSHVINCAKVCAKVVSNCLFSFSKNAQSYSNKYVQWREPYTRQVLSVHDSAKGHGYTTQHKHSHSKSGLRTPPITCSTQRNFVS